MERNLFGFSYGYEGCILFVVPTLPDRNDAGGKFCQQFRWYGGKFATGFNDTGGKFATSVNEADNLKWTWRKKFIYMLTLLPKGVQKK